MAKSTFQIDDPLQIETEAAPISGFTIGDFVAEFSQEQKELAQQEINKLSEELGYELGLEPIV